MKRIVQVFSLQVVSTRGKKPKGTQKVVHIDRVTALDL